MRISYSPNLPSLAILTALTLMACGRPAASDSQVQYGFKTGVYGNGPAESFYSVRPGQTIGLCNRGASAVAVADVQRAMLYWLEPLGRAKFVTVTQACDGDAVARFIDLVPSNATPYAQTWPLRGKRVTMEIGPSFAPGFTGPHEAGHVYGFCDLYNPASCRFPAGASPNTPSLMGGGNVNGGKLSQSDIDGIHIMVQQEPLAASTQDWLDFLATH